MHMFGLGAGHLSNEVAVIAEHHGAELVNYTDPQCQCGHGCRPRTVFPWSKRRHRNPWHL